MQDFGIEMKEANVINYFCFVNGADLSVENTHTLESVYFSEICVADDFLVIARTMDPTVMLMVDQYIFSFFFF